MAVHANSGEIEQVILNLVNNAIHALPNSGALARRISIEVVRSGDMAQLSVTDNGGGVPTEFRSQLFELLSTTKQTGMGLGLWLCKHIVGRYGGTIQYEEPADGGAQFLIKLPVLI